MAVLLLAGCGSVSDILGGGGSSSSNNEIRGTVDYVDTSSRYLVLTNVTGYTTNLSNSGGNTARVYFDSGTTVEFNGQQYAVADLERGDEVAVQVNQSNNQLVADRVMVLRDVSTGSMTSSGGGSLYGSTIRGTVRTVDTGRRTIELMRDTGQVVTVDYGTNTNVSFNGRNYLPADLERGDEIDIQVSDSNGRWFANSISVIRSVGTTSGGTLGQSDYSTLRGTVRSVDTSRRLIELEQASFISSFNPGTSTGTRTFWVAYPTSVGVDINGQIHQVSGLERGDVIDVQVSNPNATTLQATRITLVRDARGF